MSGYRLFMNGVIVNQEASGELRSIKIQLTKVGPGIFFALFSSVVLTASLLQPLTTSIGPAGQGKSSRSEKNFSYLASSDERALSIVRAVNALESLFSHPEYQAPKFFPDQNAQQARSTLITLRRTLAIERLGVDKVSFYETNKDQFLESPDKFDAVKREELRQVQEFIEVRYEM